MPDPTDGRRPVTIWLNPDELAALDAISRAEDRPRSNMGRILLAEAIRARTPDTAPPRLIPSPQSIAEASP